MDDEEMLFKQVEMTAAATKGTTVWVYRNTVYGYPWYTDVRKTLEDPAYADWYFSFKPNPPWFSKKCDAAVPSLCSDLFHEQEQSPGFPHGDGDCAAPGCGSFPPLRHPPFLIDSDSQPTERPSLAPPTS
jgi:hypothetical protein